MEANQIIQEINDCQYIVKQTLKLEGKHTRNTKKVVKRINALKEKLEELFV